MNDLDKQRKAFMNSAVRALETAPRPSTSTHSTYIPVENRVHKRKKPADARRAEDKDAKVNSANFSVMARVVDYMKKRHLNNNGWPLSLNEILEELNVYELSRKTKTWLEEALPQNPRLQSQQDGDTLKFVYKPPLKVKNAKTIMQYLKKYHSDTKGALLLSELNDCIANATKVMESLGSSVIEFPTQVNKRKDKAFFYNDPEVAMDMDEEFVKLWRGVSVDHLDEKKVEEYLQKHGISTVKDLAPHRITGIPKRKQAKRRANVKVQNTHLEGVLEEYE